MPRSRRRLSVESLEDRALLAQLTFSTPPPQTATLNAPLGPVVVSVSGGSATVTLAVADNPGGSLLGGTVTRAITNGSVTFDDLYLYGGDPAQGVTLVASSPGDTAVVSPPFALNAGAGYLHIATPITTATAGANLGPISVQVLKTDGAVDPTDNATVVTLTLAHNPNGGRFVDATGQPLTAPPTATVSAGVATFSGIRIDRAGTGYALGAVTAARNLRHEVSPPFAVTAAAAAGLRFEAPPTYAVANLPLNTLGSVPPYAFVGVTVRVIDAFGNPTASSPGPVTVALGSNPGNSTLGGQLAVTPVNGLAVYNSLVIPNAGDGYTLTATASGLSQTATAPFNVLPAAPAKLNVLTTFPNPVPVRGKLPPVQVEVLDGNGHRLTSDNTTRVTLQPTGLLLGPTTATAVAGVATFDDLYAYGVTLDANSSAIQLQAQFTTLPFGIFTGPKITLAPGASQSLRLAQQPDNVVAGSYLTAGGQPLRVQVVDANNNVATADNTTVVALGVLQNGAHSQPTFIGNGPTAGDPSTLFGYVTATAVNGVATFPQLYINPAGVNYQLALGTRDLAFAGVSSATFTVAVGAPAKLVAIAQPTQSGSDMRVEATGQGFNGYPVKPITVALTDRVGNVIVAPNDQKTISLALTSSPDGGTLQGTTSLATVNGLAFFDGVYVKKVQPGVVGYAVQASAPGLPTPAVLPFNVADTPASAPGVFPTIAFTTQPAVTGGQIAFTVQLSAAGQPATAYDTGLGPINVYLADTNGNPLVNGPYLVGTPLGVNPVSGAASWSVRLDRGLAAATQFKIRALFAYGAVSVLSDPFTVSPGFRSSPSAAPAATPAAGPSVVPVGLGSYTNDFDTAAAFPVYGKDAGGNPKPVSQLFFPPSAQQQPGATSPPAMVQPNVAAGFDQVPQSNDWWSSVMFPRTVDPNNPDRDSNGNVLFPLFADPLTAMTNPAGTFAGLGLGYLTTRFVQPTTQYLDNAALLPPGQPRSLVDPRYPGAGAYAYRYAGSYLNDSRLYQDFSVGLAGVQADAKVLRYSDWTVTLDWAGQLQATLGRGLPFAYLTASSVPAAGTPIQLVTADPKKTTTVSAFDGSGNPVTTGTGAVHLRFSYTVQEFDPTGATNPDGSPKLVPLTISNDYGLYLPSGVAWTLDNGTLTATLTAAANYFSVAVLPDNTSASFNAYRQRAYSFVTGSTSAFSYDEATSRVTTTFRLQTQVMESGGDLLPNQPLQALYPHQTGNLPTATPLTTYTYESSKGTLKVFDGPVFTTVLTHRGTLPLVAPVPDANGYYSTLWNSYLKPFLRGVSVAGRTDGTFDLANLLPDGNNYVDAQSMLGAAQLVPLLVSVSQSADPNLTAADRGQAAVYAERVFNVVKDRMSAWLSAADDQALRLLYYQPQQPREAKATPGPGWQSLMSLAAGFESSNSLNDHHLIAGYFVKVAALIARYDSTWGDSARPVGGGQTLAGKLGDVVNQMVRDVANYDRADQPGDPSTGRPPFPFLRNFDVYQGHSWADGAANDTGGNNQESASEALNFASALIQWGEATGDVAARDLGVYLFATESDSFDTYYFNVNGTDAFPTEFTDSDPARPGVDVRPNISKLNGAGSEYGGFIGLLTSNLAGIQMLPFTGGSYYLGTNPSFVLRNYAQAMTNPTQPGAQPIVPPSYQSQLLSYLALADANKALNDPAVGFLAKRNSITPVNPGDPIDNLAFTFNWIMGLRAYGQVDPTVTADTPSFAVFTKPGGRTFVAYNPDAVPKTVTFRDATGVVFTMTVPPLTTRASDAAGATVTDQGTPDFSLEAPRNRFFFTSTGGTNGFLNGTAGAGEAAVNIPAPGQGKGPFTAPTGSNSVTFRLTGVSGTYRGGDARAFFSLWLDPQYAPSTQTAPIVRVRITYDPDGTGDPAKLVVHDYNNLPLSDNPGFAQVTSPVLIDTIKPYPAALTGGTVTVQVWGFQGNDNPIRLRTDAAAEQGRVSYLDLPYDVTAVGQPPVVGPGPGPVAPPGPTLGLTATPTVAGGRYTITLAGSVADGDAGRPRAVVVDWGDGTAPTRIPLAAGGSAFSAAHVYANNRPAGRTTITAAVKGDATGLSAVATVEVGNRPPTPAGVYTAGTGPGTPAAARLYAGGSSVPARTFAPFGDFAGGVVVATGDVTGDGVEDVVVGAGAGGGPRVVVYDGADGRTVYDFFAYAPEFRGGLGGVAVGDFDGDGYADIVTGAGAGGGPHVKAFDGRTGAEKASFFAYAPSFLGGASVAAGDVTGDGRPELLTGAGPGGGPHVRVFGWEGGGAVPVADYLAFAPDFAGGVGVASGDLDGDGRAEVIAAAGPGGGPVVRAWDFATGADRLTAAVFDPSSRGGVRAGVTTDDDGRDDLVVAPGPGGGPRVRQVDAADLAEEESFFAFDPGFLDGIVVG